MSSNFTPTNGLDLPLRIVLNYTSVILKSPLQLVATLTDLEGTTQSATQPITWVSNSPTVASVDSNGLVTPQGYGTCVIEAQYPFANGDDLEAGLVYAQCQVTNGVEQILEQPTLTVPPLYPAVSPVVDFVEISSLSTYSAPADSTFPASDYSGTVPQGAGLYTLSLWLSTAQHSIAANSVQLQSALKQLNTVTQAITDSTRSTVIKWVAYDEGVTFDNSASSTPTVTFPGVGTFVVECRYYSNTNPASQDFVYSQVIVSVLQPYENVPYAVTLSFLSGDGTLTSGSSAGEYNLTLSKGAQYGAVLSALVTDVNGNIMGGNAEPYGFVPATADISNTVGQPYVLVSDIGLGMVFEAEQIGNVNVDVVAWPVFQNHNPNGPTFGNEEYQFSGVAVFNQPFARLNITVTA